MVLLLLLGVDTGFVWGRMIGYEQGKADTVKAIGQKLTKPERVELPV